jgi:glutamate-ammonia-ligase adenylyltransferase
MINPIESYSSAQVQELRRFSPAVDHALELLRRTPSSEETKLRQERSRSWTQAAFATFYETSSAKEVCAFWSLTAERMVQAAARACAFEELGIAVFALGKLGAGELNLSSDIDLILMIKDASTAESAVKPVRRFLQWISSPSEFGPGFRVDLDLRPGGPGSPLLCPLSRFQDYYWTQAELWERMALVRLRPLFGDENFVEEVCKARDQFCYRKYLDYSLLEELKRLRPKIHRTAGSSTSADQVNFKLDPGYIRDIELFINAHQIIYGGKELSLRTPSTTQAAENLSAFEKRPRLFSELLDIYWKYRQWENQVQAVQDFQTHTLDLSHPPAGWRWPDKKALQETSAFVDTHITDLLGAAFETEGTSSGGFLEEEDLLKLGYSREAVETLWPEVKKASVLSRQKEVDETKRAEVIERFLKEISQSAFDKDLGLKGLMDFLNSIRAKATFFHLLSKEGQLIKDLSFLFGLSPYLGSLFSNRPELIDSFLFNRDEPFAEEMEKALVQMAERKRLAEIRAALHFLKHMDLGTLTKTLTATADQICTHMLNLLQKETSSDPLFLLALGKWGGEELGFRSDLDFVFVSPHAPTEKHHRLVRRFISRLRDPSVGGSIYQLDTRLRPEGKGGALIIEESALWDFLKNKAQAWERQAYLKGRWVNQERIFQKDLPLEKPLSPQERTELKAIREKLIRAPLEKEISLKFDPGGLVDIELALQTLILQRLLRPTSGGTENFFEILKMKEHFLYRHYLEIRKLEQMGRMLSLESEPSFSTQKSHVRLIAKILQQDPEDLVSGVKSRMKQARAELLLMDPTFS